MGQTKHWNFTLLIRTTLSICTALLKEILLPSETLLVKLLQIVWETKIKNNASEDITCIHMLMQIPDICCCPDSTPHICFCFFFVPLDRMKFFPFEKKSRSVGKVVCLHLHSDSPAFLLCEATLALLFSDEFVWSLLDMAGFSLGFVFKGLNSGLAVVDQAFFPCVTGDERRLFTQHLQGIDAPSNEKWCTPGAESVWVFLLPANCSSLAGSSCNRPVWSQWQWSLIQWFKL